jgi:hypothetical protein
MTRPAVAIVCFVLGLFMLPFMVGGFIVGLAYRGFLAGRDRWCERLAEWMERDE